MAINLYLCFMPKLFSISDFELFTRYSGVARNDAPEAYDLLKEVYDKLRKIVDKMRQRGYYAKIICRPLNQGQKYQEYHWAQIYPKEEAHFHQCEGKVFFVIGATEDGFEVHIDSMFSKGYTCNAVAEQIKESTWLVISPEDVSQLDVNELADRVDQYITQNWKAFNEFAREFNIKRSMEILENMHLDQYVELLKANYNLILTGAPGTGKTFLAKRIAEAMGATTDNGQCCMVQFHPSYDYTDFVEGLRPVANSDDDDVYESSIGFSRQNGVFKNFCEDAVRNLINSTKKIEDIEKEDLVEKAYHILVEKIESGQVTQIPLRTASLYMLASEVSVHNNIRLRAVNGSRNHIVSLNRILKLAEAFPTLEGLDQISNINDAINEAIKKCNASAYWAVLHYIYKEIIPTIVQTKVDVVERKNFVMIIDEINRGEISKIFGELFFSIDPGYRGSQSMIKTQYQNLVAPGDCFENGFYVPENLYIIGTMNDIDRSVESMDFAMRRRFAWMEVSAESSTAMLRDADAWHGHMPSAEIVDSLVARMTNLNNAIVDRYDEDNTDRPHIGLSGDFQIGGSYFLKYALYDDFDKLWDFHLSGLLNEYLRGATDRDEKLKFLHTAYNDSSTH
ncbi:MAG: AAA family ATPase [Bacteroides sp.]|nr:AAA family ATPase [Bacteroides sp.]